MKTAAGVASRRSETRRGALSVRKSVYPGVLSTSSSIRVPGNAAHQGLERRIRARGCFGLRLSQNGGIAAFTLNNESFVRVWLACGGQITVVCVVCGFEEDSI